ncbi:MAG: rhomboid family intramembrane serine protease [Candidatus Pacearchaeota archaeon]
MRAFRKKTFYSTTNKIILTNILIFIVFTFLLIINEKVIDYFAVKPANIFEGKMMWTIFTSMFLHANLSHLFVNMVSLFFIGNFVEKLIGKKRMLLFYLLSGIIASLFFVFLSLIFKSEYNVYAVGASGAIFALASMLMVIVPKLPVFVFFIIPMPLWGAMLFLLFGLWIISYFAGLPIGNTAHFGGFVTGLIYGIYLRIKYNRKVKILNLYLTRARAFS